MICKILIVLALTAAPLGAQLNAQQGIALYEEARAALDRQGTIPSHREKLVALLARLRTASGWNHAGDVYELLQIVRAHQALAVQLPGGSAADLHKIGSQLDAHLQSRLVAVERRLRNPDRDNLARYEDANQKLAPAAAGEQRVVFLGDSITDGWRLADAFPGRPFVNRGISGQITGEMLGRMKADVIDLKPAAMVVLAGTNDLARGVEVAVVKNNLAMIGDLARANGIKVIFASVLPVSDYAQNRPAQTPLRPPEKIREINSWLEAHCRDKGCVWLDYHTATADSSGLLKAELANDGLHPNAAGYKIMAPLALAAIERTLAPPGGTSKKKR